MCTLSYYVLITILSILLAVQRLHGRDSHLYLYKSLTAEFATRVALQVQDDQLLERLATGSSCAQAAATRSSCLNFSLFLKWALANHAFGRMKDNI
jgi:hypothetical protein